MSKYRNKLPQLSGDLFLTDGGLETTLIFHEGFDLPDFAAFDVMKYEKGKTAIRDYFRRYAATARKYEVGFILESATWRASSYWGKRLEYSDEELAAMNHQAIEILHEIRDEFETDKSKMVISGCVGPPGDGYKPEETISIDEAEKYHAPQIEILAQAGVDQISALTISRTEEAIGLTQAAKAAGMPIVISFTVETDGRLHGGMTLKEAIEKVDDATDIGPAYYMINCAHPTHFEDNLTGNEPWVKRICGIRANASDKSHAELDNSTELDDGDPVKLGSHFKELRRKLSHLNVFGGCCGTDHRHIEEIGKACA